ncbi:MAG: ArnT family glycosyltransferase [Anaerolineaceae bacterium]
MIKKSFPHFPAIIGLVWLIIIILGYEVTHFSLDLSVLNYLWKFFAVFLYVCLAGGIGFKIWVGRDLPILTTRILQVLLGFGILVLITLILGMFWRVTPTIITILWIIGLIAFSKSIYAWFKSIFNSFTHAPLNLSGFEIILWIYLILIFAIQLFQSFAPPIKYDALIYHLTLPKIYLDLQRIDDIPWLVMSGMPQTAEMMYLDVMAVAGETAPLILNWFFGILTSIGLFGFLKEKVNAKSSLVGVVCLFSGYTVVSSLSWGYVDWVGCLFGMGMTVCIIQVIDHYSKSLVFLSGIFAGLAFSTKYPAGVIFLCGFFTLSLIIWRNKSNFLQSIWRYFLGASLFAIPWLLKNLILTGNPVYPFFFPSGSMDLTRLGVYQGMEPYGDLFDLFLLPIRATIQGIDGTNGYSVSLGPLFLGFSILAFLGLEKLSRKKKTETLILGLLCFSGIFIWAVGNQISGFLIQTRFYFSLFPAFTILAAFGFENLENNMIGKKNLIILSRIAVVIVLFLNIFQITSDFVKKGTLTYLFNLENRQAYLERNLGWYALVMEDIQNLPSESRILSIFEPRGYECVPACDPDEILDQWKISYSKHSDNDLILSDWKNAGYTHLLVYQEGIDFLKENPDPHHPIQELNQLQSFLATISIEKNFGGIYTLYRLDGH